MGLFRGLASPTMIWGSLLMMAEEDSRALRSAAGSRAPSARAVTLSPFCQLNFSFTAA